MSRPTLAVARPVWAAAFLFLACLGLAACGGDADAEQRAHPAVSYASVAALRAEGAARFLTTDAALAEVETAVAALDSAGQASARPRLDALRGTRATLQARLDSLDAERFASQEVFDSLAAELRDRLDALDASIARDRVLLLPDAAALRAYTATRMSALLEQAESLRADSSARSVREAARLDSARVRLERHAAGLASRNVQFDSLRGVLAEGFGALQALRRDTLALRFRPDSLR